MSFFVFVTGGVMSSLGKGVASASIGALISARGFSIRIKKLDPYINVDPGTMSPYKHGEVFVMEDGCEADLDFGHYERFTGTICSAEDSLTTGKVYESVINRERRGDYLGSDIQVIPHITDEIKKFIMSGSDKTDFTICEIGGTVGDIEGFQYIEAIRQITMNIGKSRVICVHLTYLPYLKVTGELKTRPTQHSVKQLQSMGIQPDIILCRSEKEISDEIKEKLAMFCSVHKENVIPALDAENIYLIPGEYHANGLDRQILKHFDGLGGQTKDASKILNKWNDLKRVILRPSACVKIAILGKYTKLRDAYISLVQALYHGGFANDAKVEIVWIDTDASDVEIERDLAGVSGVIVPGGFGKRGYESKIAAIRFARENDVPFLGICLGMQLAVIEACRNVAGLAGATSSEFDESGEMVIDFMGEWDRSGQSESRERSGKKGGTMRLGSYACKIIEDSLAHRIYETIEITERHRHRYEVAIEKYKDTFRKACLFFSGMSVDGKLPEIVEIKGKRFFIATQAHPEFKSYPFAPHPLFAAFIRASIGYQRECTRNYQVE
jgi:CTP synthase